MLSCKNVSRGAQAPRESSASKIIIPSSHPEEHIPSPSNCRSTKQMFDGDLDDLDLGSRRKATVWVATAPPVPKEKPHKKGGGRSRKKLKKRAAASSGTQDLSSSSDNSCSEEVNALRKEHGKCSDVDCLEPEVEHGCVEYKQRIKDPNPIRFQQLVTQMQFRLMEGCGKCIYYIGVHDDGYCLGLTPDQLEASLSVVRRMADALQAFIEIVDYLPGRPGHQCAVVEVKKGVNENITSVDVRIAVAGTIDSGKSTLIAVLTHGSNGRPLLDSGLGSARTNVLKHKHEIESGRTSSISQQLLGYDDEGRVLNYTGVSSFTPAEIGTAASRQIHFIDMAGHEKYVKTSFYGLTSMLPDYMILCISAVSGIGKLTREQLAMAFALDIPVIVVLTMMDLASTAQFQMVVQKLSSLVKSAEDALKRWRCAQSHDEKPGVEIVAKEARAEKLAELLHRSHMQREADVWDNCTSLYVPVFPVSNVTGNGLHMLHALLRVLEPMGSYQSGSLSPTSSEESSDTDFEGNKRSHFIVDHVFDVESVGMVVSGTAVDGSISIGQELNLGPDSTGKFVPVLVESIHRSQVPVRTVKSSQGATLALKAKPSESELEATGEAILKQGSPKHRCLDGTKSVENEDAREPQQNIHPDESFRIRFSRISTSDSPGREGSVAPPSPTTNSLKGTVLLDSALSITTAQEFECIMVLLGGHWPARGLISGKWPPLEDAHDSGQVSLGTAGDQMHSKSTKKKAGFSTTIHMGNIRQAAQVVSMEEIRDERRDGNEVLKQLPAPFSAAIAVVTALQAEDPDGVPWCVARVGFRFVNRPEWVQEGARFIARDKSEGGNLSGIGVVKRTLENSLAVEDAG